MNGEYETEETLNNEDDPPSIYCYSRFEDSEFDKIEIEDMDSDYANVTGESEEKSEEENLVISLSLSGQQLRFLPAVADLVAGLRSLEKLDLSCNLLTHLPESIGLLINLKVLDISRNSLSAIPESISHCGSLVELDISFNDLKFLPNNFGHGLVNLKKLSMQLNNIRYLPLSIGEMISLTYMDVHFNNLHGLPDSIGKLKNLEVLNLSSNFNCLTSIPTTIGELTNLRELDLSNNQIQTLPDSISQLVKITKLNLDQNPLVTPREDINAKGIEAVMEFLSRMHIKSLAADKRCNCKADDQSWSCGSHLH